MKTKQLFKWQMINITKGMLAIYCFIVGAYICSMLANLISGEKTFTSTGFMSGMFLLVNNIVFFQDSFKFSFANGISRKTLLVTHLSVTAVSIAIMIMLDYFISFIYRISGGMINTGFIEKWYGDLNLLSRIILLITIYCALAMVGYFIGAMNLRLSKLLKMIIGISIPVLIFVIAPLVLFQFSQVRVQAVVLFLSNVLNYFKASPYNLAIVLIIVSALFYIGGVLFVRKAPLKSA